ncbi:bifunctional preprotein translocase subunit SecD/SecF [Spiroplasma helicoides]|uniref:Bifunctional preprotein translocase subunit SecD/SecF n=1 Tax=Spiroplasma helicoides TaxID=216938 RepID=A0A1B3SK94_9MOLU|nr:protein translocase SecDF, variant type [Spiroplasma helicoides]AOG60345.1 bifunctional preprotein translocase subunit SecD/SecF [Spiroplasma helicoides]
MKDKSPKKRQDSIKIWRVFIVFVLLASLFVGIFFSSQNFLDNYRLGSDIKGYYSALVAVNNANEKETANGQPNGKAADAASVLEQRLNPMGTNQIIIETAGDNYLKVLSPIDAYDSQTQFRNQIQRNGGAILLNENYEDLQLEIDKDGKVTRSGINDYFSGAQVTTVTTASAKNPAIEFKLNGSKFSSMFTEQKTSINMELMIDADGFYNDLRNFYASVNKDNNRENVDSYFTNIIEPLRIKYNDSNTTDIQKKALDDLFAGRYKSVDTGGYERYISVNLLNPDVTRENFEEYIQNHFEFLSDTSKYVYDPNSKSEDFNGTDAKYASPIEGYNRQGATVQLGKLADVFKALNGSIGSFWKNQYVTVLNNEKKMANKLNAYFLYAGTVYGNVTNASYAYVDNTTNSLKIIFANQPESTARIGASVFNASTKGFIFTVNNISQVNPSITSLMLSLALIFLGVVALGLLIYAMFMYRILGLFMIVVILAIASLTLMSTTWFGLTLGVEAIIAIVIIISINLEIFSMIFENMKFNFYLKQRSIKTSYNISIKENIGLAVDVLVALVIPAISMFWIASNSIQSFAIIILMGVIFSFVLSLIFATILNKFAVFSNMFNNRPKLFALNTDFANQGKILLNYKIRNLENKIEKNKAKGLDVSNLISKLEACQNKIKLYEEKEEIKQAKLNAKYQEKVLARINALEQLKTKLASNPKKANKILKIDLKINEYKYILEDKTDDILTEESEIILQTEGKVKVKKYEKSIKTGSFIILFIMLIFAAVSGLVGGLFKPNYDSTFGNRTEYTMWGSKLEAMYNGIESFSSKSIDNQELKDKVSKMVSDEQADYSSLNDSQKREKTAIIVYKFLDIVFSNPDYVNAVTNSAGSRSYQNHNYYVSYGTNYNYVSSAAADEVPWVTLSVITTDNTQSFTVKNVFAEVGGFTKEQEINANGGFISKRIKPSSIVDMSIQMAYGILTIVLALIIYIFIRFKWTYYIAMVIGILLAPVLTVGVIVGLYLPVGMSSLIAVAAVIVFSCFTMFIVFGKSRSLIANKDEKSMYNYFKQEIEFLVNIKNARRDLKNELFMKKSEIKIKIKEQDLEKPQKKELYAEYKKFKQQKVLEFKNVKKANKIEINRVSKKNNYLKEVMVQTFKYGMKRSILVGFLYVIVSLLLSMSLVPLAGFGISIVIGVVSSIFITLFLALPVWVIFEQTRIRNHLSRKRFINNLKVAHEEQIIEGIND